MKKLIALLFLFPVLVMAQKNEDVGVKFERNITEKRWKKIIERAKAENKYIIIFCDYPGCVLCKEKNKEIFLRKDIGEYFNNRSINIYLQIDTNLDENEDTDGSHLLTTKVKHKDKIKGFPTFIIFDSVGKLVHKRSGIGQDATWFIELATTAFNKDKQYFTLLEQYNNGNREVSFLKKFFLAVNNNAETVDVYLKKFIQTRDNLFTKENAEILMNSYSEKLAFEYLHSNQEIWRSILDNKKLDLFYIRTIETEINRENIYINKNLVVDKDSIIETYSKRYPDFGKKASLLFLLSYYNQKKDELNIKSLLADFVEIDTDIFTNPLQINSYAWLMFNNYNDKSILNKALSWSKKSLEQDNNNPAYLDTYANILYKLGQAKEAIEIETKALELVKAKDKKSYEETLDKMQKGEPTWK